MFYCLADATYILYDENTVTDVFPCLGIKWHSENMFDFFVFFVFFSSAFSLDISVRIIETFYLL